MSKLGARELTTTLSNAPKTVRRLGSKWSASKRSTGKWRMAMLVGILLSGAGTAFAVRAYNSIRHEPTPKWEDRPSSEPSTAATPVARNAVAPAEPSDVSHADKPLVPATPATSPAGAGDPASGNPASRNPAGAKSAAQGPAESKARQLARVWVYWDAVYPSAIKLKPGTVLLRMENEVGFDVNLVLTRLTGGGTGHVTTLGAQGKTLRSIQVLELGAGLYEYYDESRPQLKGRLIVEP
jgi:hypothetical protein